jgi:hypothetical protein
MNEDALTQYKDIVLLGNYCVKLYIDMTQQNGSRGGSQPLCLLRLRARSIRVEINVADNSKLI